MKIVSRSDSANSQGAVHRRSLVVLLQVAEDDQLLWTGSGKHLDRKLVITCSCRRGMHSCMCWVQEWTCKFSTHTAKQGQIEAHETGAVQQLGQWQKALPATSQLSADRCRWVRSVSLDSCFGSAVRWQLDRSRYLSWAADAARRRLAPCSRTSV